MLKTYKEVRKTDVVKIEYFEDCFANATNITLEPTETNGTYKITGTYCEPYSGNFEAYVFDYQHKGYENYKLDVVGTL